MHGLLVKTLTTLIFLILSNNGISKELKTHDFSLEGKATDSPDQLGLIARHCTNKHEIDVNSKANQDLGAKQSVSSLVDRSDDPRSYYGVPAPPYIPTFDPISVLACLAFLAFLLQSFAALFDRTRSIIPTIISSRHSNSEYDEGYTEIEKRVLHALEEYASFGNHLLNSERESEKS